MAFGISNLLPCILSFFFLFFVSLACIVHRAYATRSASTWTPVYDVACEWGMQEDPRKGILRSDQLPQLDSNRCIVEKERMNERSKNASRDPTRKSVPRFFFGTSIQLASSKSPVHSAPGSPSRVPDHNPIDLPLGDGVVLHRNDSLSCNMSPSCIYACLTLSQRQCQYPAAILGSTETRGEQASEGTSRKHVEFRSECVCRLSASCPRPPAMLAA
ncbi:hypothetical protein DL98DRAFT_531502 [Cadophora sp. DSE1049]|nr:hypothetical protein DL98DRAFT_531502 [Cadophora sp. DSE1049]